MYENNYWKNAYNTRKRVDRNNRYPKKSDLESKHHMTPMEVLQEYCRKATLHGIRYTMREGAPTYDRLIWVVALVICTSFAGMFINTAWDKFRSSPTVTTVETTHLPLHEVPFPAITVCPAVKINRTRGLELLKEFLNMTYVNSSMEMLLEHVMSAFSMLQHPFYQRMVPHLQAIPDLRRYDSLNVTLFMLKALPTCKEVFKSCYWLGRYARCCDVFHLQRSESGFCYSFNSLTAERGKECPAWVEREAVDVSGRRRRTAQKECELRRNTGAGTTTGLEVFLRPFDAESRLVMGQRDVNGARILIHHPTQFPEAGTDLYMPEMSGDVLTAKISPAVTVTNEAVRSLPPEVRNCIFPDERKLTVYHTYTQSGCLTECRVNFIESMCGCSPYYYNSLHDTIPECKLSQLECIANHTLDLRFFKPPEGTRGFSTASALDCLHCLPTCHDTVYNLESSFSENSNPEIRFSKGYLDVYYKDLGVVKYRRTLMFDTMQLIVSFGGIAGLFLGVSLLTLVELFYYATKFVIAIFYVTVSWRAKQTKRFK